MTRVLLFVAHYLPSYRSGGPVRSIANLVEALGDEIDFSIVTRDRDALDEAPFAGIASDNWVKVGKARVWYGSPYWWRSSNIRRVIEAERPDLIYLNSFFDWKSGILPLLSMRGHGSPPVLLAPRGEMAPDALRLKRWKKLVFRLFARLIGLHRGVHFQASSPFEATDIRRQFGNAALSVASDIGPGPAPELFRPAGPGDALKIIHVARVTPMKNLLFALRAVARCKARIDFTLLGPVRDAVYMRDCRALIRQLPDHVRVLEGGEVAADRVREIMAGQDLLFLPTRGENFGHVVPEALSVGLPVLLSDRTPWRDLESKGLGWDLPLEAGEEAFAARIDTLAAASPEARTVQRRQILSASSGVTGRDEAIAAHRALFASLAKAASEEA